MKTIVNVTPGIIPIPPNGWGAVEKIIWEFHNNLLELGYDSKIMYLDEIPDDADIVHIHVANLALEAHKRGIPYYFTTHDHHAYLYGKDSPVYKENLLAMKYAIKAFVPAKYLVDYFEGIPEYFSHGVNTQYFSSPIKMGNHKLLCVANNGYIHNQSEDRKGFGIAIQAAERLGLPITIAGPENNKNFFEHHPQTYDKLTILYNLSEDELLTVYKNHSIFLHPSQLEAGHPNLTLLEAMSCGLPVVGTLEENGNLNGMIKVTPTVDEITGGIQTIIDQYGQYSFAARKQAEALSWKNRTKELLSVYLNDTHNSKGILDMKKQLISHYQNTKQLKLPPRIRVNVNGIDGIFAEILGGPDTSYNVQFIDKSNNNVIFSTNVGRNCWAKANAQYFIDWKVVITDVKSNATFEYHLDLKDKRVLICFESKSLGDTLAWIPYVEEFRKKHGCKVVCSTFWNDMFRDEYRDIEFISPGEEAHNLVALYRLGLFYDGEGKIDINKHPHNPIPLPLQQTASDILGLEFVELVPKIKQPEVNNAESKQVAIAIHSTAQTKYWNNPFGWQEVVNWLKGKGYTVKLLSNEGADYMGNKAPTGVELVPAGSIESAMEEIKKSKAFIGLSSGLSWLSWTLRVPTVMISGFTDPVTEMKDCIRISAPKNKCSGCWSRHRFDPGDWNWCPDHKGTPRQFECSREITADMVIRELEKIL